MSKRICVKNLVLAEISAKKPSYSRQARLTVDGALPIVMVRVTVRVGIRVYVKPFCSAAKP